LPRLSSVLSGTLPGAVGALHLLPKAGGLLGGDLSLPDGWLDVIPGLLCERQDCTFTVGGFFTKKRTIYKGKCTPTPIAPWLCSCSPI